MTGTRDTPPAPEPLAAADLARYLDRIGVAGAITGDLDGLRALVAAHGRAVPFENLDIPLARGVSLDPDTVFDKIVRRRRGGYCFEQNGLFARVLATSGFDVRVALARVWLNPGGVPPLTHAVLLVTLDGGDWLVDVGFGGGAIPVLRIADGSAGTGASLAYRLRRDTAFGWILAGDIAAEMPDPWRDLYSFTGDPAWPADLAVANHYTSTAPGTRFTTLRIVNLGAAALTDHQLTLRDGHRVTTSDIAPDDYLGVLRDRFGIDAEATHDEIFGVTRFD